MLSRTEEEPLDCVTKTNLFLAAHWRGVVITFTPLILLVVLIPVKAEPLPDVPTTVDPGGGDAPAPPAPPAPPGDALRNKLVVGNLRSDNAQATATQPWQWAAYTLLLMAIFWVTECIPLAVTSFFPVLIFPMAGVMNTRDTCKCYINDSIMMFVGSLMLAYSVEQSGLHKRLAYCAIKSIGYSHFKLLLAMCCVTTFVSLWITNTAATTMMIPINFAILKVFENQGILKVYETGSDGEKQASDITTCYFCAATFSATIGGLGTLVGTATNLVFKGLYVGEYPDAPEYLSFPKFSMFAMPCVIIMETLLYFYLCIVYFGLWRSGSDAAASAVITPEGKEAARKTIESDSAKMGNITVWELLVILLFGGAMFLFFGRSPQIFKGWGDMISDYYELNDKKFVRDSALAMFVAFGMFLLPSTCKFFDNCKAKFNEDLPKGRVASVLNWKPMNANLPYSFMFLLGGGFALSEAAKHSGLNDKIGDLLQGLNALPNIMIIFIIILVTCIVTNFASNVAVCNVFAPIAMTLARNVNQHPLWYNIAAGFTSSYCFMIPVGTPGNLIVQSAASVPTKKMIIAGAGPTVVCILVTWLAVYFYAPIVWPDLLQATEEAPPTTPPPAGGAPAGGGGGGD